ncbi:hypothetical protein LAZ67_21001909 [Cordylochernes scorpioides]|uniref:Uncharacterized protein n=1 Tax=Cordylochernes scorpioides TaxID=51811 RepID=A0ABY6LNG0_9ARAC|nr:hypothetical protein LAZ67_21001909 [Cordylochernes scorpioides]
MEHKRCSSCIPGLGDLTGTITAMGSRSLFEGANHAALYARFRPKAPPALIDKIMAFVKKKVKNDSHFIFHLC